MLGRHGTGLKASHLWRVALLSRPSNTGALRTHEGTHLAVDGERRAGEPPGEAHDVVDDGVGRGVPPGARADVGRRDQVAALSGLVGLGRWRYELVDGLLRWFERKSDFGYGPGGDVDDVGGAVGGGDGVLPRDDEGGDGHRQLCGECGCVGLHG